MFSQVGHRQAKQTKASVFALAARMPMLVAKGQSSPESRSCPEAMATLLGQLETVTKSRSLCVFLTKREAASAAARAVVDTALQPQRSSSHA